MSQGAEDAAQKAARLKAEGNKAFRAGEHSVAIRLYTEALEHGAAQQLAEQHLLYSNRSQAFLRMAEHEAALRSKRPGVLSAELTAALENITDEDYRIHGSGVNQPGINAVIGGKVSW